MRILCIGDIVGKPGRQALRKLLPALIERHAIDLVIANAENASGGMGLTPEMATQILSLPVDLLTGGNHLWKFKSLLPMLDREPRILRPLNYPEGTPGRGYEIVETSSKIPVGVISVMGRAFMDPVLCPFEAARRAADELRKRTPVILVEIHAEATSEKRALGWFLDGRVSAVYGTHTHVATADNEILPKGTAYITDIGMTGPHGSVIGMRTEDMIQRFVSMRPAPFNVAKNDPRLCGVLFDIDAENGKALAVQRLQEKMEP
jgi:metallophosphoesterase (TIGR00282 family)